MTPVGPSDAGVVVSLAPSAKARAVEGGLSSSAGQDPCRREVTCATEAKAATAHSEAVDAVQGPRCQAPADELKDSAWFPLRVVGGVVLGHERQLLLALRTYSQETGTQQQ